MRSSSPRPASNARSLRCPGMHHGGLEHLEETRAYVRKWITYMQISAGPVLVKSPQVFAMVTTRAASDGVERVTQGEGDS